MKQSKREEQGKQGDEVTKKRHLTSRQFFQSKIKSEIGKNTHAYTQIKYAANGSSTHLTGQAGKKEKGQKSKTSANGLNR